MQQWRPLEQNELIRNPHYSPDRDLAYVGPSLMGMAMMSIDDELETPRFKEWCKYYDVTLDEIKAGAEILGKAMYQMDKYAIDVLKEQGFFELKLPVQAFFFKKLGEVTFAAIHYAVREVSPAGSKAPQALKEFCNNIYEVFQKISADILKKEKFVD
jgi:hypothetical protein